MDESDDFQVFSIPSSESDSSSSDEIGVGPEISRPLIRPEINTKDDIENNLDDASLCPICFDHWSWFVSLFHLLSSYSFDNN
ncbi:hypothetical protein HMI55_002373 [Coelomomyces lativittatus]|nr:hypothetical protein HMI56_005677 [Coelomomyces lativittatus]KAJ1516398.1 hypothetical protein HMI55_002373 [Coelomomyces lativittatus]